MTKPPSFCFVCAGDRAKTCCVILRPIWTFLDKSNSLFTADLTLCVGGSRRARYPGSWLSAAIAFGGYGRTVQMANYKEDVHLQRYRFPAFEILVIRACFWNNPSLSLQTIAGEHSNHTWMAAGNMLSSRLIKTHKQFKKVVQGGDPLEGKGKHGGRK